MRSTTTNAKTPSGSGRAAIITLGINVVLLGVLSVLPVAIELLPLDLAQEVATFSQALASLSAIALIAGAFGFLTWLRRTYEDALRVAPTAELAARWSEGPVRGFFIPILNFVRPYRAVRALDAALDPERVPMPPPRAGEDAPHYRASAAFVPRERRPVPAAPVGVWWALWIGSGLAASALAIAQSAPNLLIAAVNLSDAAAAFAACIVVRRIDARLVETSRRRAELAAVASEIT